MVGATAEVTSTGLRLKPGEGIEAVQGFCRGLNALDEFSDVASQLLSQKYPHLGPLRVSFNVSFEWVERAEKKLFD